MTGHTNLKETQIDKTHRIHAPHSGGAFCEVAKAPQDADWTHRAHKHIKSRYEYIRMYKKYINPYEIASGGYGVRVVYRARPDCLSRTLQTGAPSHLSCGMPRLCNFLKGDLLLSRLDAPKEMAEDRISTYVHELCRCFLIFIYLHECLWLVCDFR